MSQFSDISSLPIRKDPVDLKTFLTYSLRKTDLKNNHSTFRTGNMKKYIIKEQQWQNSILFAVMYSINKDSRLVLWSVFLLVLLVLVQCPITKAESHVLWLLWLHRFSACFSVHLLQVRIKYLYQFLLIFLDYWILFVCRMLNGAGAIGAISAAFVLTGEIFDPESKVMALQVAQGIVHLNNSNVNFQ